MEERTVKIKSFVYHQEFETPTGGTALKNVSAKRGETVELTPEQIAYGDSFGAFVTEEDEAMETALAVDVAEMDEEQLVDWVSEATIPEILNVAKTNPELAKPLLAAENIGTGNDPRSGIPEGLAEIVGSGEVTVDPGPVEVVDPDATPGAEALAEAESVDLAQVTGTGKDGRITKDDVQEFIDSTEPEDDESGAEDDE